eukprot:CAMPEP_0198113174 /NCGR_PEP_ID=MMETSP1442-20131203/4914_1 /TAXON_ID= /ORGANISM="Craspedostauros australis, Strain CCMP3328" /LENGTH=204 /DNA_ID=CAMNT_0043770199 /DNA_START=375 /DNA_END=989 /DNA_ORIENTATION=+
MDAIRHQARIPIALQSAFTTAKYPASKRWMSSDSHDAEPTFTKGSKVQVEVVDFGPLGASVELIGIGHEQDNLLSVDDEPYGLGLILQDEISYFRQGRNNLDVVRGEILPAYVADNSREDGKMLFSLRVYGGKGKADEVSTKIMEQLEASQDGTIAVGDKSSPQDINALFPGVSKGSFKKAVGALYRKGMVQPSPNSVALVDKS